MIRSSPFSRLSSSFSKASAASISSSLFSPELYSSESLRVWVMCSSSINDLFRVFWVSTWPYRREFDYYVCKSSGSLLIRLYCIEIAFKLFALSRIALAFRDAILYLIVSFLTRWLPNFTWLGLAICSYVGRSSWFEALWFCISDFISMRGVILFSPTPIISVSAILHHEGH